MATDEDTLEGYEQDQQTPTPPLQWHEDDPDDQPIFPSSYNIANPVPPISTYDIVQQNEYQQNSVTVHTENANISGSINYNRILLNENKIKQKHHSYLISPGKTVSSCDNNKYVCSVPFEPIFVNIYAFIIFCIDYIILPISTFIIIIITLIMIFNQCKGNIQQNLQLQNTENSHKITSNCQCIAIGITKYSECVCPGIDDNTFDITNNGLIYLCGFILLFFLVDYLSFICLFFKSLFFSICCCKNICFQHCFNYKSSGGYYIFIIGRISGIIASCLFLSLNNLNSNCHCYDNNDKLKYCGPVDLNRYMELLWIYCTIYVSLSVVFITGRTILKCVIKNKRYYYGRKLIQMVLYQT